MNLTCNLARAMAVKVSPLILVIVAVMMIGCAPARTNQFALKALTNEPVVHTPNSGGSGLITEIYNTDRCGELSRGGFVWMTDPVLLESTLAGLDAAALTDVIRKIDIATQGLLLADFGRMPTPGFRINLASERLDLVGDTAVIKIDLVNAALRRKKMPQVLTHPCSLYVLPRAGYSVLEVRSDSGDLHLSFSNR